MMRRSTNDSTQTMDVYLNEIKGDALLTAEEEKQLAVAIAEGDRGARSRMIRANLRLVVKIAGDYQNRGLTMDDLVGEGNIGLLRAVQQFDPAFGTRFSTYAAYWIKQAIRHALANAAPTIRLPAHMIGLLTRWRRAERSMSRVLGRSVEFHEVADELGLSDAQRRMVESAMRSRQIRQETASNEDEAWTPEEATDSCAPPDAALEADDEKQAMRSRLAQLDEREQTILSLRFGLDGDEPLTLKEVGRRLGVTREWVRKIEVRAVDKLGRATRAASPIPARRYALAAV
ncbi:RNA polymerase sigma factor RpoD/SigA [Isosphaeraceae bacterium EP7]